MGLRSSADSQALDEVLRAEVCAQVHDLPDPERKEERRGADAEPLDACVGALVRVAQLLLAVAEVVHLVHDLADDLLDAPKLCVDWLELLDGRQRLPVLCVGADVDVEVDLADRLLGVGWMRWLAGERPETRKRRRTSAGQEVLYAHVKRGVGVRRKDGALLAGNVLHSAVVVAKDVLDVHVDNHSVALMPAYDGRHHNERVLGRPVAYASLAPAGRHIHLERRRRRRGQEQEHAPEAEPS